MTEQDKGAEQEKILMMPVLLKDVDALSITIDNAADNYEDEEEFDPQAFVRFQAGLMEAVTAHQAELDGYEVIGDEPKYTTSTSWKAMGATGQTTFLTL